MRNTSFLDHGKILDAPALLPPFFLLSCLPFCFSRAIQGLCHQDTGVAEKWKKSGGSHELKLLFAVSETQRDPKFPREELQPLKFRGLL